MLPLSPGLLGKYLHVLKKSLLGRRRLGGKPTMAETVRPTENLNEGSHVPGWGRLQPRGVNWMPSGHSGDRSAHRQVCTWCKKTNGSSRGGKHAQDPISLEFMQLWWQNGAVMCLRGPIPSDCSSGNGTKGSMAPMCWSKRLDHSVITYAVRFWLVFF